MASERVRADGRLTLDIVGGFLGAGKSTWLRHQLHEGRWPRAAVIVNEAAGTPVDNLLLARAARLYVLAGGCACCDGLAALVALLRGVCDAPAGIDGIVLETSGLADPGRIARAVAADPVLGRRLAVGRVVVLADGTNGAAQLAAEPLARAQAEAADTIVITRPLASPDAPRLAATLRALNPTATLTCAEMGVPVAKALDPAALPLPLPALAEVAPIVAHRLDVAQAGGWAVLSAWLSAVLAVHGEALVRAKGVVSSPRGRLLLQSVRGHVQPPEILPPPGPDDPLPEDDVLVLIGRGLDPDRLRRSWERLALGQ